MKRRKIVKGAVLLLIFGILLSGCNTGKLADRTVESKSKELNWAIAGLWGFENEESISEERVSELNQLLVEKGKDYQIKFRVITFDKGQLSEEDEETLRKCDLITMENQLEFENEVKFYSTMLECQDKNLFEPLDKYMQTENGMKIKERMLTDLTLESGYWEGKQWLLPTKLPVICGSSLMINKKLYEKSGVQSDVVPDFTKCDDLFEKLFVANGNQPFLTFSDRKGETGVNDIKEEMPDYLTFMLEGGGSFYNRNVLGSGDLISVGHDLDTRNILKDPYFEEYLKAWKRYVEKGYVNSNMNAKTMVEISNSYQPEMIDWDTNNQKWVIPKSENYVLKLQKQPAIPSPCVGIGAESKQKELAFEVLTDLITDKELNEIIQNFNEEVPSGFVFHIDLSETGEKEYQKLVETIPRFTLEHTWDSFSIPEIAEINKVYAEYSTEENDDSTQKVLERHFSKDGTVTEESIHEGIQRLNEKLDAAGMEKFIEALKEQKLKSKR